MSHRQAEQECLISFWVLVGSSSSSACLSPNLMFGQAITTAGGGIRTLATPKKKRTDRASFHAFGCRFSIPLMPDLRENVNNIKQHKTAK
jgi:hypothetical protein